MLDIKYIRENQPKIEEAAKNKNIKIDINNLLSIDNERRDFIVQIDAIRERRNELAKLGKGGRPSDEQIAEGKKIKEDLVVLEEKLKEVEDRFNDIMVKVPTIPSEDTPIGKSEDENVEIYTWGEKTKFDFKPKDYMELAENLDLLDLDRGTKVAGYRGYYLKNEAVSMAMGLMMMALNKLVEKGFKPMIPPTLIREYALFGSGYFSGQKYDADQDEIYKIANDEKLADGTVKKEDKFLVGTAEPSLLAYYSGETLDESELPIKICGFSQCYRSEIGSYGKDAKGIYRVHEFMKVEQVCLSRADLKESDDIQQEMVAISKELHEELGLPHRTLQICTGDMSAGKYKMFDMEAWIPSRNAYGETGSASNFLDWQSRRLNVKYKTKEGDKKHVYMLNNTALATTRPIISILENFQQADGSVVIPEPLRKFMPGNIGVIKPKK